jgi:hypothetical protein
MGAVFRPKDLSNRHRKIISNDAIEDLSPDTKDSIIDKQNEISRKEGEREPQRANYDKDVGIKNRKSRFY